MPAPVPHRFSYLASRDGVVRISANGRVVKTLKGHEGLRFLERAERSDTEDLQLLMARATGQYKFGNER